MNQGFLKFKNSLRLGALVKSAILGLAAGSCAAAIYIIVAKLNANEPKALIYLPLGILTALAVTAALFFLINPSDKKAAKLLDNEFGLNEKVQTMVAFGGDDGDMIRLQREDTEARLATIKDKLKPKRIWIYISALLLAIALPTTAAFIPTKTPPQTEVDPDFDMDSWQETSLKNLIKFVKESPMVETAKQKTVNQLEALLDELIAAEKVSEMKTSVISAIVEIDKIADEVTSYPAIYTALSKSENELTKTFATVLTSLGKSAQVEVFLDFIKEIPRAELSAKATEFSSGVRTALNSAKFDDYDPLHRRISAFITDIEALAAEADALTDEAYSAKLETMLSACAKDINAALRQQSTNRSVSDYTIQQLILIFEIPVEEIPNLGTNTVPGDGNNDHLDYDNDKDLPSTDGGLGSGEAIYGSDEKIYDPVNNRYVAYGELLNEYYATITDFLLKGELSDEEIEYINEYFAILYDGSKKD